MAQARAVVDSPPTKSDPFGGKQANVDFRDTDIEEAFRSVLASNGYTLRFTPEARACIQGFVTMKCTGYSLNDVLALIVRSCSTPSSAYRLRWSVENNIVTFRVAELNADGLPNKRVTLNYPDRTPLQTVLEDLAAGTDIKFRLAPPPAGPNILPGSASFPPSVTTRVRENNVSFKTALDDVLRRASRTYTYRIHSFGVVTITDVEAARADAERRAAEQAALEAERAKAAHARAAEASNLEYVIFVGDPIPDKRITIDFKTAPFRTALEQVFNTARVDWSLDNNVQGSAVTLQYQDAPLSTVLAAILKQSSTPITCANSNGVLIIRPRVAP